jgi:hypothetical protein
MELLERLTAMIPKARINLLLYHGAFAPHFRARGMRGAEQRSAYQRHAIFAVGTERHLYSTQVLRVVRFVAADVRDRCPCLF